MIKRFDGYQAGEIVFVILTMLASRDKSSLQNHKSYPPKQFTHFNADFITFCLSYRVVRGVVTILLMEYLLVGIKVFCIWDQITKHMLANTFEVDILDFRFI